MDKDKEVIRKLAELMYVVQMAQSKEDWEPAITALAEALRNTISSEGGKP